MVGIPGDALESGPGLGDGGHSEHEVKRQAGEAGGVGDATWD